jgi:hypothetical protein
MVKSTIVMTMKIMDLTQSGIQTIVALNGSTKMFTERVLKTKEKRMITERKSCLKSSKTLNKQRNSII